jgi:alpha-galactosidase
MRVAFCTISIYVFPQKLFLKLAVRGSNRPMHCRKPFLAVLLLAFMYTHTFAQSASIQFDSQTRVFRIDGDSVSYVFGINDEDSLQPLYWGARLGASDRLGPAHVGLGRAAFDLPSSSTPQEFQGWGAGLFYEPALKITFEDGNRDLVLHYVEHHIEGNTLTLQLKDISRDIFVTLKYQIDPATGVLGRSASIVNKTKEPIVVEQAAAASWSLPDSTDYWLYYLTGRWAGEMNVQHEAVRPGARVLESRRGSTGQQNNPWFAIERGNSDEERLVADHRRAGHAAPGARDRRLQSLRLWIQACAQRAAGNTRLLWWIYASWHRRRITPDAQV